MSIEETRGALREIITQTGNAKAEVSDGVQAATSKQQDVAEALAVVNTLFDTTNEGMSTIDGIVMRMERLDDELGDATDPVADGWHIIGEATSSLVQNLGAEHPTAIQANKEWRQAQEMIGTDEEGYPDGTGGPLFEESVCGKIFTGASFANDTGIVLKEVRTAFGKVIERLSEAKIYLGIVNKAIEDSKIRAESAYPKIDAGNSKVQEHINRLGQ